MRPLSSSRLVWSLSLCALMAGCGGGGGGEDATCQPEAAKGALRSYMRASYLWNGEQSPNPEPAGFATPEAYFPALLFKGANGVPADRWSGIEDAAQFAQFFKDGQAMGYGFYANLTPQSTALKVRYVEAQSSAAAVGLRRGDEIVSVNGRSVADLAASGDFAKLNVVNVGDKFTLQVNREGAATRTVEVTAAVFNLTPVTGQTVFTLPGGKKAGYLSLKEFISQAEAPLAAALGNFRQQGATELILDLRENGGGQITTATRLASLVAGSASNGRVFAELRYNAQQATNGMNQTHRLASGGVGAAFTRVVVLTSPRTCSASELVVNGLKPYVDVVTVGDDTCGKPVGFNPHTMCGKTYNAVNFDVVNARGEGGYYAGIPPSCEVADDFSRNFGDAQETLTAAALDYLQNGKCPGGVTARAQSVRASSLPSAQRSFEPGARSGMWID
jgi:carboxyl-terminal processing protease